MGTKRVGWARIRSLINENANQLKIRNDQVVAVSKATTLTSGQSGATVYWTHSVSNHDVTLPAAAVGMNFKFVLAVGHANSHNIKCAAGDEVFGKVTVVSTTADVTDTQLQVKTDGDTKVHLSAAAATRGGNAGDTVHLVCAEAGYWVCTALLTTTNAVPAAIAVLV